MNRFVHYDLTLTWARETGFADSEALTIARANWACDSRYTDLAGKRYHWGLLGAPVVSVRRFRRAVRDGDLSALGEALHSLQDTLGHGVLGHLYHWPGIDRWEQRGEGVRRRIEGGSRKMLAAYRSRLSAASERQ